MSGDEIDVVRKLASDYFWGWQEQDWGRLRSTLADDVEFEDPRLGTTRGADVHVALYVERRRFPKLTGVSPRRGAYSPDTAYVSYDVYLGHTRKATVIDQLTIRDGRIVHVLAVAAEWWPR